MKSQEIRSQLRELVPRFAEEVAPLYKSLNWEWQPEHLRFIPTKGDITRELYRLIDDMVLDEGEGNVSTGGLKVFSEPPNDYDLCWNIGLEFEFKHIAFIGSKSRRIFVMGER